MSRHRSDRGRIRVLTALTAVCMALLVAPAPPGHGTDREYAGGLQWGTAGDDVVNDVATHADTLYTVSRVGNAHASVTRHHPSGAAVWSRSVVGPLGVPAAGHAVAADASGVYVGGDTTTALTSIPQAGERDGWIRKYTTGGSIAWTWQFGSAKADQVTDVLVADGYLYVGGHTTDGGSLPGETSHGATDFWVRKHSLATGEHIWTQQYGGTGHDASGHLVKLGGHIYATGRTLHALPGHAPHGPMEAYVVQFDAITGAVGTVTQYGTAGLEVPSGITTDAGRIYISGLTDGTFAGQSSAGATDAFVMAYSPSGSVLWVRQFGTSGEDAASDLLASAGRLTLTGHTTGALTPRPSAGAYDLFLQSFTSDGRRLGATQHGAAGRDVATAVAATAHHGWYIGGGTSSSLAGAHHGAEDAFLVRWAAHRPDAMAKRPGRRFVGDNTYGAPQRVATRLRRGRSTRFVVRAQNDGEVGERLRIRGCANPKGLTFRFVHGRRDVTRAVRRGRYLTPVLETGGALDITVKVRASHNAGPRTRGCVVAVVNTQGASLRDQVKLIVRVTR